MKACTTCGRLYPREAGYCPVDGSALIGASQAPPGPDDADPRLGQVLLGRYEVRRVVADGGMGRVYEALDLRDRGRNVALKVLHPDVAKDAVQVQRFKREYEVSAQLSHDHVISVHEFSKTVAGEHVMVMEFLFGEELRATLDRERGLSLARALRMVSQIARALDEAHQRKFVHRDLKPDNIFLCQTPEGDLVKLLDFGSVKDRALGAAQLTVLGTTIGSPFYMSPEQAQGLVTLDHRADVWALGCIVFEALTGKVPFFGQENGQILLAILTKHPAPISEVGGARAHLPKELDLVLARAFRKEPSMRFASAGELADAFGRALGLSGNHDTWAHTQEAQLATLIDREAGRERREPERSAEERAQDAFFGEVDVFHAAGPPPISLAPQSGVGAPSFTAPPPISLPPGDQGEGRSARIGRAQPARRDVGAADTVPRDRLSSSRLDLPAGPAAQAYALSRLSSRMVNPEAPTLKEKALEEASQLDSVPPVRSGRARVPPDSLPPSVPPGVPRPRSWLPFVLSVVVVLGGVLWWTVR